MNLRTVPTCLLAGMAVILLAAPGCKGKTTEPPVDPNANAKKSDDSSKKKPAPAPLPGPHLPHAMTAFRVDVGTPAFEVLMRSALGGQLNAEELQLEGTLIGSLGAVNPDSVAAYESWVETVNDPAAKPPPIQFWVQHRVSVSSKSPERVAAWLKKNLQAADDEPWCPKVKKVAPLAMCLQSNQAFVVRTAESRVVIDVFGDVTAGGKATVSEEGSTQGERMPVPVWATEAWTAGFGDAVANALAAESPTAPIDGPMSFWLSGVQWQAVSKLGALVEVPRTVLYVDEDQLEAALDKGLSVARRCDMEPTRLFDTLTASLADDVLTLEWAVAPDAGALVEKVVTPAKKPRLPAAAEACKGLQACALWSAALDRDTLTALAMTDSESHTECNQQESAAVTAARTWPNRVAELAVGAGLKSVDGVGVILDDEEFVAWIVAPKKAKFADLDTEDFAGDDSAIKQGTLRVRGRRWSYVASSDRMLGELKRISKLPAAAADAALEVVTGTALVGSLPEKPLHLLLQREGDVLRLKSK